MSAADREIWKAMDEARALRARLERAEAAIADAAGQLARMAANPMKSWDAGLCVDAIRVEEIADELRAALAPTPPEPPREPAGVASLADFDQTTDEAKKELERDGVDVESFLAAAVPLKEPTCAECEGCGTVGGGGDPVYCCPRCKGTGRTPEVTR